METPEDALITSLIGDTSTPSGVRLLGGGREGEGGRGREREGEGREEGWDGGREGEREGGRERDMKDMLITKHIWSK